MRDTIVIGTSAGGIDALGDLVQQLPPDLPASVLVVLHLPGKSVSMLPQILSHRGRLPATSPIAAEHLAHGRIYVARPDYHLMVDDGSVRSVRGPRVNGLRPAIDVLFRSAAHTCGGRVIAVVLTGMLDDGVGGLREVRSKGGIAVVQDPEDATHPMLPKNAIAGAGADHVVRIAEMGSLLVKLAGASASGGGQTPPAKGGPGGPDEGGGMSSARHGPAQDWSSSAEASPEGGRPSVFSCPECHGVLSKTGPDDLPRFVCRVGHAYDPESLLSEQATDTEKAIWSAVRALEERASFARKLELRARGLGDHAAERQFADHATEAERQAAVVRAAERRRGRCSDETRRRPSPSHDSE